ncbi:MFS transporter [Steroidobacter sp.]|uniref:MFS transporter n=1 Tax=Steroidobacter sp. TaxID=1978227 RepID=UPI001A5DA6BA|nr:MFS transporter [Steroidobacter sp.]MBL8270166.1 MFS transporter [Steroidobacter sp.]
MPLPAGVWALGMVSLFMDISSEMVHALLPVFVVGTLGAGAIWLGVIEGVAEATACIVKVFSGALSDRWGKRKSLALLGYGLAAITKPLFPLAGSAGMVFAARCIDRVGKGIRGAPRDALVADYTTPEQRGAAYGLRQSLDTVGAFIGPLIAIGLLVLLANDVRAVFWIAVIPALIAVAILWLAVKEPTHLKPLQKRVVDLRPKDLPKTFWVVAIVATFFTLARFSEAFLILRGADVGLTIAWTPLVLVVMNIAYMCSAYPVGVLADRMPRHHLLIVGAAVLIVANLMLAGAKDVTVVLLGVALWGLHMGLTEGVFTAMIADAAPENLRGTAFGVFNLMRGLLLLLASVIAGVMWQYAGPPATFITASVLAAFSMLLLLASRSMLRA